MAEIKKYGFLRHLRSDANVQIIRYSNGRVVRSGRGIAFWFSPHRTSVAQLPMDDRDMVIFFKGRSKDFQTVVVQGSLTWRVTNPNELGSRVDFSLDLGTGRHIAKPTERIESLITGTAMQVATQYLAEASVHDLLDAGIEPLRLRLEQHLSGPDKFSATGLEVTAVRLSAIAPTAELEKALQTPTFESLQQKADQAVFERRALAVEKERAIAENELQNKTELARRETQLIAQESANAQKRAEGARDAKQIEAEGEASRVRAIEQAHADMEQARVAIFRELPVQVLLGMAARELAAKLNKIDHLNITPELVSSLMSELGKPQGGTIDKARS